MKFRTTAQLAFLNELFLTFLFQQEALIKQLQEQHYEQYMSQVYAQQAQAQAASLEAARQKPSDSGSSDDSEAGPKPADAYLQQGLERPPPRDRVRTADESADSDEDDVSDEDGGADTDVPGRSNVFDFLVQPSVLKKVAFRAGKQCLPKAFFVTNKKPKRTIALKTDLKYIKI